MYYLFISKFVFENGEFFAIFLQTFCPKYVSQRSLWKNHTWTYYSVHYGLFSHLHIHQKQGSMSNRPVRMNSYEHAIVWNQTINIKSLTGGYCTITINHMIHIFIKDFNCYFTTIYVLYEDPPLQSGQPKHIHQS